MVTADDVRRVGLALPRSYEFFTGGRAKLKVRQIVYAGFSRDETQMGFGYPKDARDGLIESAPDTFSPVARRPPLPGEVTLGGGHCRSGDEAVAAQRRARPHLRSHPTPKPPAAVEVRDGQLYRWSR